VTPLIDFDFGLSDYCGFTGGLYANGKNSPPAAYLQSGITLARTVQSLGEDGEPSNSGKIVMISIGMSNASHEFSEFIRLAQTDERKNPNLVMIDAARDGAAAIDIALPFGSYWKHVDSRLRAHEVSPAQVQVVWLKSALAHERRGFPENARLLQRALRSILEILETKFPQLKLVYVSSRIYGGYSETDLSPEPAAYESGFAVKWLIEECINRPTAGWRLWVSWGPYLWADGLTPRSDGLVWERTDFEPDGVHPSPKGASKVATKLLEFFQKDLTARTWFLLPQEVLLNPEA